MEFNVEGKVAVVTGSSRGLGYSSCEALVIGNAKMVILNSRKQEACDEAVELLKKYAKEHGKSTEVHAVAASLSDLKGVTVLVEGVKKLANKVDILMANAGASWGASFDVHPEQAFDKVLDLNLKGVFLTIQQFAPLMKKKPEDDPSRVLINASIAGMYVSAAAETYGYVASKAGVIHLGKTLALQLPIKYNINVNVVCPGFFPSKMSNGLLSKVGDYYSKINPRRRLGKDSDLKPVILFLCAKETAYLNGLVFPVDGGYHLSGPLL